MCSDKEPACSGEVLRAFNHVGAGELVPFSLDTLHNETHLSLHLNLAQWIALLFGVGFIGCMVSIVVYAGCCAAKKRKLSRVEVEVLSKKRASAEIKWY